jgi:hypothetical protein
MFQKGSQKGRGDFHTILEKPAASFGVSQIGSTVYRVSRTHGILVPKGFGRLCEPEPVAKFIVPDGGGFSRLRHNVVIPAASWRGNPVPESNLSPQSGTKNLATGLVPKKTKMAPNSGKST